MSAEPIPSTSPKIRYDACTQTGVDNGMLSDNGSLEGMLTPTPTKSEIGLAAQFGLDDFAELSAAAEQHVDGTEHGKTRHWLTIFVLSVLALLESQLSLALSWVTLLLGRPGGRFPMLSQKGVTHS